MEIQNLKIATSKDGPSLNLKFSQGKVFFRNAYVVQLTAGVLQLLPKALSYLLEEDKKFNFHEVKGSFFDHAGISYDVERGSKEIVCRKNGAVLQVKPQLLLSEILNLDTQSLAVKNFVLKHFQILGINQKLFAKIQSENAEDDINFKFVTERLSEVAKSCEHILGPRSLLNLEDWVSFTQRLKRLHTEYFYIRKHYEDLMKTEGSDGADCKGLIYALRTETLLLEQIEKSRHAVMQSMHQLNDTKQVIAQIEARLNALDEKLSPHFKDSGTDAPDWDTAIKCLSYINVLEQMIPTLEQVIKKSEQDEAALKDARLDNEKSATLSREAVRRLDQCIQGMSTSVAGEKIDINPSEEFHREVANGWFERLKASIAADEMEAPKLKEARGQLSELRDQLRVWVGELHQIRFFCAKMQDSPFKTLDQLLEILNQSKAKLQTLKQHWSSIAKTYHLNDGIGLDAFLELLVHYNERNHLRMRLGALLTDLEEKGEHVSDLNSHLHKWHSLTGSLKLPQGESLQFLLAEAANVVRLKKDKEKKLDDLIQNQAFFEARVEQKRRLIHDAKVVDENWRNLFAEAKLSAIAIDDPRLDTLCEKLEEFLALNALKTKLIGSGLFQPFSDKASYPPLCTWFIADGLDNGLKTQLLEVLSQIPKDSIHIFLTPDPALRDLLVQKGLGRLSPTYLPAQAVVPVSAPVAKPIVRAGLTKPAAFNRSPVHRPSPSSAPNPARSSAKVQTVVDILNGYHNPNTMKQNLR